MKMRAFYFLILVAAIIFAGAGTASALTVSPARIEITGDPGTTINGEVEITNEEQQERTFYSSFENFESQGDSGAPHFIGANDGLATWMTTEESVVFGPDEKKTVPFSISIPADAPPGGYFTAIFFGSQDPASTAGGNVSIGGKIGVLVLLRVSGEVKEGAGLLEFSTVGGKRFFTALPVGLAFRIGNTGGDRIVPSGEIKIRNTFRMTSSTLEANKGQGSVLPGSARRFETVWQEVGSASLGEAGFFAKAFGQVKDFHFGWYTANLDLAWGTETDSAKSTYHFFIIPWQLLVMLFIILSLFLFVLRFALVRYKRFIVKQTREAMKEKKARNE